MERSTAEVRRLVEARSLFVAIRRSDGATVAMSGFNASLPDVVQIGGVFTPPELRSQGYGRAVVAGSLVLAREQGVGRSVLFTPHDNVAAQRAYEALGYVAIGDYGLVVFELT